MYNINRSDIEFLNGLLKESQNIVIATHVHPDGDALGSSFGLFHYLREIGIKATVIVPDSVPETLSFLLDEASSKALIVNAESADAAAAAIASADLLICLDFNSFKRAEGVTERLAEASCRKVLIDHHLNPDRPSFDLVISETEISSASELLFWVLMSLPNVAGDANRLPAETARCLMTGMTTDTNNFGNSVYPSTLEMASILLAAGVDRDAVVADIYNNYREERYRLLGHLLADKLTITKDGVAYMIVDADEMVEFDVKEGDTEAFVNMPLGIARVRMSIFLKQQGDVFRVSVRSKRGTSANLLAGTYFHGGGHELAAGGKLIIPDDAADAAQAAAYIERVTSEFFRS